MTELLSQFEATCSCGKEFSGPTAKARKASHEALHRRQRAKAIKDSPCAVGNPTEFGVAEHVAAGILLELCEGRADRVVAITGIPERTLLQWKAEGGEIKLSCDPRNLIVDKLRVFIEGALCLMTLKLATAPLRDVTIAVGVATDKLIALAAAKDSRAQQELVRQPEPNPTPAPQPDQKLAYLKLVDGIIRDPRNTMTRD